MRTCFETQRKHNVKIWIFLRIYELILSIVFDYYWDLMSESNDNQNSDLLPRKKRKAKRKANSPLNDTNNGPEQHNTRVSSLRSGVKGKPVRCVKSKSCNKNSNKNNIVSNSLINTTINNTSSGYAFKNPNESKPIMSFSTGASNNKMQQQGSAGGIVQGAPASTPGGFPNQAQHSFNTTQTGAGVPSWASELIHDVKQIKLSMTKLDQIERTVNMINMKVSDLEVKVNSMEPRVTEVERSCTFISHENDDRKKELERARTEINKLRTDCASLNSDANALKNKNAALEAKVTDLESRSMRDNLLFYGIAERGQLENCEELIKNICIDILEIPEAVDFKFDRVHRVGSYSKNKVRPIVGKFHNFKRREIVRQKAFEKNAVLKHENLGIGQQWPAEVRESRKALFPIMQREKALGKDVKLVKDKLFIDNVEYKMNATDQRQQQNFVPQTYRQPQSQPLGWNQGHPQPGPFGYMLQQSPPRQWIPPPPPVAPGQPGSFQWVTPAPRMPQYMQESSEPLQASFSAPHHVSQLTATQQHIPPAQQGRRVYLQHHC